MAAYFSNWLILFPVAFSLLVAVRLSQGRVDQSRTSWSMLALQSAIALMFCFALLAIGLRPSPISILWIILLGLCCFVLAWKSRRLSRAALLLTGLAQHDLPHQMALAKFFSDTNRGWLGRTAKLLQSDLAAGVAWERALEKRGVARSVFERLALRLRYAYGAGDPVESRKDTKTLLTPLEIEAEAERLLGRLLIFSWIFFIPALIGFIFVFIMPTLAEIFEEFDMRLPGITLFVLEAASMGTSRGLGYLFGIAMFVLALSVLFVFLVWLIPSLTQMPGLRWFCESYYSNVGLVTFANLLEREPNVLTACRQTSQLLPVPFVAGRYQAATELMEKGAAPVKALLRSKVLNRRELKAFGTEINAGDPTWELRELASWKTERMLNRYSVLVQIAIVVVTLLMAVVIGLVVIAIIAALTELIISLA